MNLSPKTVDMLRVMEHDSIRLSNIGMQTAEDEKVVEIAKQEGFKLSWIWRAFSTLRGYLSRGHYLSNRTCHTRPYKLAFNGFV